MGEPAKLVRSPADPASAPSVPVSPDRDGRFAAVFEHAAIGIALVDMGGHPVESNAALVEMLGYSAEELAGMVFTDFTHPDDAAADWDLFEELVDGRRDSYQMEKRYFRKDGALVWGRLTVSLIRDENGAPAYAIGMVEDITERKEAEARLESAEERYRSLVEQLPVVVYISALDEPGTALYVSPQYEELTGFTVAERMADPGLWKRRLHPEDRERVLAEAVRAEEAGESLRVEYRLIAKDDRVVWVREEGALIRDRAGRALHWQGVLIDITEKREAEDRLAESLELLEAIFRSEPECVKLVDSDGALIQMNPAGLEMIEADDAAAVIGASVYALVAEEHREAFRALTESTFEGRSGTLEFDIIGLKGTRRSMEMHTAPLRDPAGKVVACLSITRDVSERKLAAAELEGTLDSLRRSNEERLGMLARLVRAQEDERRRIAADVHDDTIQKLTALRIRLDTLRRKHGSLAEDPHYEALGTSVQELITGLRSLIFELRPPSLETGGLVVALREYTAQQAKLEGGPGYEIGASLTREPPEQAQISMYRLIREAVSNARRHARASFVRIALSEQEGGFFAEVVDDGVGFDVDAYLDPEPGHLGLNDMRERAQLAGGWASVASHPGRGTRVQIWLPADPAAGPLG